jgi:hypothetical protein
MTPSTYKVRTTIRTCGVTFSIGQTVYRPANDFGLAADACLFSVLEYVSISANESGTPFYVVPLNCLEPVELPKPPKPSRPFWSFEWPSFREYFADKLDRFSRPKQ